MASGHSLKINLRAVKFFYSKAKYIGWKSGRASAQVAPYYSKSSNFVLFSLLSSSLDTLHNGDKFLELRVFIV